MDTCEIVSLKRAVFHSRKRKKVKKEGTTEKGNKKEMLLHCLTDNLGTQDAFSSTLPLKQSRTEKRKQEE